MNPATHSTIATLEQSDVAEVAEQFVLCYYKMMNESPDQLHRFYQANSSMIYEDTPVFGQKSIHEKFMQLSLRNNCGVKVHVLQLDALRAHDKIVIQVAGEISADKSEWRRFMQTFVLGEISANNFFVMTDIFRFQDRVFGDFMIKEQATAPATVVTPVMPVETAMISKPVPVEQPKVAVEKTPTKNPKNTNTHHQNGFDHHHQVAIEPTATTTTVQAEVIQVKETTPVEPQVPKSWAQMATAASSNGAVHRPATAQQRGEQHVENNENPVNHRPGRGGGGGAARGRGGGGFSDRMRGSGGPRNTNRGGAISVGGGNGRNRN